MRKLYQYYLYLVVILFTVYSSCVSSRAKKGVAPETEQSSDAIIATATSPQTSELFTECHTIIEGKRHIYNLFRSRANPSAGGVHASDPTDPLAERYYEAAFDVASKAVTIILGEGDEQRFFVINRKDFKATLKDKEGKLLARFQCENFIV